MNEWNVIHEISTQNTACSQCQMDTCHTSFSYILWAYNQQIKQQNIWSVHRTSIRKENRSRERERAIKIDHTKIKQANKQKQKQYLPHTPNKDEEEQQHFINIILCGIFRSEQSRYTTYKLSKQTNKNQIYPTPQRKNNNNCSLLI